MNLKLFRKKDSQEESIQCPSCKKEVIKKDVILNHYICTSCGYYFRVRTVNRINMVCDRGSFTPLFEDIEETNPLSFPGYDEKLKQVQEKTGLKEAITVGYAKILEEQALIGTCDARFMMSSMGQVVGEKVTRLFEKATEERLPVILFCASGGARMQEGLFSLMQMAKTSMAIKKHSEAGLLYVSVLTDPTTGGVTASFASLGDYILAEPGALIGFAGQRVIEQTIGQRLPEGFQRAEFLLKHGMVDRIVERDELKSTLHQILKLHRISEKNKGFAGFTKEVKKFRPSELSRERATLQVKNSAWERVKEARSIKRPDAGHLIEAIFDHFIEWHGDRYYGDDNAVIGGTAWIYGQPVTVIGIRKGSTIKECEACHFGMASPEGYRKALRLMKQAEKFHRPIICFVNTAGAYPGMEAEERGQGEAIARNLYEMSALKVPILSIITGEGGSGGALALSVSNEVWMFENATYSILSPEGFASILWKDGSRAKEAAGIMGITADVLKQNGMIEEIIPEYGEACMENLSDLAGTLKEKIAEFLWRYDEIDGEEIARMRQMRFRKY